MPIKGMTDDKSIKPSWPRLGILRKGGKKTTKTRPGPDLEFFRFTSENPKIEEVFYDIFEDKPDTFVVLLPFKDIHENFETWMEEWGASGLVHRCDGETMVMHRTQDGTFSSERLPCPYASGKKKRTKKNRGCVLVGRLHVILPELIQRGNLVGHVTLLTGSNYDIRTIISSLAATAEQRAEHPKGLQGVPFVLRRYKGQVSRPTDEGGRVMAIKSLVMLIPTADWTTAQLQYQRQAAFALPDGTEIIEHNGEVLAHELTDDDDELPEMVGAEPEKKKMLTDQPPKTKNEQKPPKKNSTWPAAIVTAIVKRGLAENSGQAVMRLNMSNGVITEKDELDAILEWALVYNNTYQATGDDGRAAKAADEAVLSIIDSIDAESAEDTFGKQIGDSAEQKGLL